MGYPAAPFEPFGLIYLEAMASGTPVIASASGGPLSYVTTSGPHATGWLPAPGDLADLAATIEQALTDPAELTRRGAAARRFAVEHYSWHSLPPRYLDIYDRVLADRPCPPKARCPAGSPPRRDSGRPSTDE